MRSLVRVQYRPPDPPSICFGGFFIVAAHTAISNSHNLPGHICKKFQTARCHPQKPRHASLRVHKQDTTLTSIKVVSYWISLEVRVVTDTSALPDRNTTIIALAHAKAIRFVWLSFSLPGFVQAQLRQAAGYHSQAC
jgi:hypothetical protein